MGNYPKHRKKSGNARCDICGKTFTSMGIGTHRRQKHETVLKVITIERSNSNTKAIDHSNRKVATGTLSSPVKQHIEPAPVQAIPDPVTVKHLYTDQDLYILSSKWIRHINNLSEVALFNQFTAMDLIADFERRFKCKLNDVKEANKHLIKEIETTLAEHPEFTQKYVGLEYSR